MIEANTVRGAVLSNVYAYMHGCHKCAILIAQAQIGYVTLTTLLFGLVKLNLETGTKKRGKHAFCLFSFMAMVLKL